MALSDAKTLLPLLFILVLSFTMIYSSLYSSSMLPMMTITSHDSTPVEDLPQVQLVPASSEKIEQRQRITAAPVMEDPAHLKEEQPRILERNPIIERNPCEPPTSSSSSAPTLQTTKNLHLVPTISQTLSPTIFKTSIYNETKIIANQTTTRNQTASGPLSGSNTPSAVSPGSSPAQVGEYNGTNSFGACLFWMDDYERLIEWIAYHYQVLPMRHLVMYRDPKSIKDPTPILDRWKRSNLMEITYWTSVDNLTYVPESKMILKSLEGGDPIAYHNKQQGLFYRNCLCHLKRTKWTWTFVGDTDEMLVLNSRSLPLASQMMNEPGIILKTILAAQSPGNNKYMKVRDNMTVQLIKNQKQQLRWGNNFTVCWCLARQQFSGFESPKEAVAKDVPAVFDPYRFQTVRFRYHKRKGLIGKCIIDASRVTVNAYTRFSPHKLIRECGTQWGDGGDLMQVYHYLGTWDYFERPNDYRGGDENRRKVFMKKNLDVNKSISVRYGDTPRKWLSSFLDSMGEEKSLSLLDGVGFPFNNQTALPMMNVTG